MFRLRACFVYYGQCVGVCSKTGWTSGFRHPLSFVPFSTRRIALYCIDFPTLLELVSNKPCRGRLQRNEKSKSHVGTTLFHMYACLHPSSHAVALQLHESNLARVPTETLSKRAGVSTNNPLQSLVVLGRWKSTSRLSVTPRVPQDQKV